MRTGPIKRFTCIASLLACAGAAIAQDSVSTTPGQSDALLPYNDPSIVRYTVDLAPLTSSWGNALRIGPVLKATADDDPLFSTQILGGSAMSPDQLLSLSFASTNYSHWTTAGAGVNQTFNSIPGTIAVTGFDRQFGIASSDFSNVTTNAVGALVGQSTSDPSRLYVTRIVAASGQLDPFSDNTSTITVGAVDASGNMYVRADDFASSGANKINGENVVRISLPTRIDTPNRLFFQMGFGNRADQQAAVTYIVNAGTVTTNTPAVLPNSLSPGSKGLVLDFANLYRPNGAMGVASHLDAGVTSHRGNPSFTQHNAFGGVGTVASLARAVSPGNLVNAMNLFAVDAAGATVATRSATLPQPITDGAGYTANTSGASQFLQYLSQVSFRGGNGPVAVGFDPTLNATIAAATATDPTLGDFIAVARLSGGPTTWTVAAHVGKQVLNGPSGSVIGTIASSTPVSISSPAADLHGNIYFVGAFQPTVGSPATGLFKAVNTPAGYRLELLLSTGAVFNGPNSARQYTITSLTLGDSDSIASGSFFSSSVLQRKLPGAVVSDPAEPLAFGGAIVNATITYNNGGTPEPYQAVLFVGPAAAAPPAHCDGDANGDNMVDFDDITASLANWGAVYTPGSSGAGDANNDGVVNFDDITTTLANWASPCS
jgi:hypothetical protein